MEQLNVSGQRTRLVRTSVVRADRVTATSVTTDVERVPRTTDRMALYVIPTL